MVLTAFASIGATGGITGSCIAPLCWADAGNDTVGKDSVGNDTRARRVPGPRLASVPRSAAYALEVRDATVRLGGVVVLDGLSLAARTGSLTAVLGPNGAGKTTLLRCCTGLVRPDAGEVRVLGLA